MTLNKNYWDQVIDEVENKHSTNFAFQFTSLAEISARKLARNRCHRKQVIQETKMRPSLLGRKYSHIRLTPREAECMDLILDGKTNGQVGEHLKLSSRTVEYYVGNLKQKLHCRSKSELIGKVRETVFEKNYRKLIKEKQAG